MALKKRGKKAKPKHKAKAVSATRKKKAKASTKSEAHASKSGRKRAVSKSKMAQQAKKKSSRTEKPAAKKTASKAGVKLSAKKTANAKSSSKATAAEKSRLELQAKSESNRKREAFLPTRKMMKSKVLPREFLVELSTAVRDAVVLAIGASKGREVVGTAPSGDATFELDKIAEKALLNFLKSSKMPVAYYSEDSGYTTFTAGQPKNLLIVDPIDGTRAAKCGFENCVVSVASTRVIERPLMQDVDNGCVMEILGNRVFYAERGKGTRVYIDGHARKVRLSQNANLETVSWFMTVPARPAELIFPTAAKLIDLTSLKGGFFACNSTAYSLTRLLTNQIDAVVDFANRFYRDIPTLVEDHFINAGRGVVLGICPYDFVAAVLIAQEGNCVVTDAYGDSLDDVLLLDSSVSNQRSLLAAANKELHEKLLNFFDTRIRQFELLLQKRAEAAAK